MSIDFLVADNCLNIWVGDVVDAICPTTSLRCYFERKGKLGFPTVPESCEIAKKPSTVKD